MKNIAIVIGDSLHNTYGLIRSLGECNVDFYFLCLSNIEWEPIERSRYIAKGRFIQFASFDELPGILDNLKDISGNKYIICSSDPIATWVDNREEQLSKFFITPCRGRQIGTLFNKKEQCELANECGLTVPQSLIYSKGDMLDYSQITYPVFIKPLISSDGSKVDIQICRTAEELKLALENARHTQSFIIQEYIEEGYDLDCVGFRTDKQIVIGCAIRKYRAYPNKYGAGAYMRVDKIDDYNVNVNGIERFLEQVGYYGPFSVEFIHSGNKNYFMEVNFRNDGLAYSTTCAGLNLYESYLSGKIVDPTILRPGVTMNVAFDFALWRSTKGIPFIKWLKQFMSADGYLDLSFKDPMPILWRPIGFVLRRLKIKS